MPIETIKQGNSYLPSVCTENGLHFHGHKHAIKLSDCSVAGVLSS